MVNKVLYLFWCHFWKFSIVIKQLYIISQFANLFAELRYSSVNNSKSVCLWPFSIIFINVAYFCLILNYFVKLGNCLSTSLFFKVVFGIINSIIFLFWHYQFQFSYLPNISNWFPFVICFLISWDNFFVNILLWKILNIQQSWKKLYGKHIDLLIS